VELITKIFLIIIACAIIGSLIGYARADDYFTINGKWDNEPRVCIQITEKNQTHGILKALTLWEKKLNEHTNSTNWNYNVNIRKTNCDIDIFQNQIRDEIYGETICNVRNGMLTSCDILIFNENIPETHFFQTFTHELGHALGLGHRLTDNQNAFPYLIETKDLMLQYAAPHQRMTNSSLAVLIILYGEDGFEKPNNELTIIKIYPPH